MFAGTDYTFRVSKRAYFLHFRHCAVGHFSPDQFQFWLVTLPTLHLTMDTQPQPRTLKGPRIVRRGKPSSPEGGTTSNTSSTQLELVGATGPRRHRAVTLHKVPSTGSHSHSALADHSDFRNADDPTQPAKGHAHDYMHGPKRSVSDRLSHLDGYSATSPHCRRGDPASTRIGAWTTQALPTPTRGMTLGPRPLAPEEQVAPATLTS